MSFLAGRAPKSSQARFAAVLLAAAAMAGCNSDPSGKSALEKQEKESGMTHHAVAKFAGRVSVDGQPPAQDWKLFVILTKAEKLDENANHDKPTRLATCNDQGHFEFGTYDKNDGVPVGKYVVTFVELHSPPAKGKTEQGRFRAPVGQVGGGSKVLSGPDELKNLYNDPDKNSKEDRFKLDLQSPGKDDYEFDLPLAGKEAAAPGPNAVTKIAIPR